MALPIDYNTGARAIEGGGDLGPLSRSESRALSSALETIYGITSVDRYPAGVLSAVRRVLPCNTICFNEMAGPVMTAWVTEPANALPNPLLRQAFLRNFSQHPVLSHYTRTGDGTSYRISDFVSRRQFHKLSLYSEYYRASSVEYQLIAAIAIGPRQIGVALDRDLADFSDEERLTLELLRPHLVQAYRNAQTLDLMRQRIEGKQGRLLVVGRSGQIRLASDGVWRILDGYFEAPCSHNSLPDTLGGWAAREASRFSADGNVPSPSAPLVVSKGGQKLVVRFLWGGKTADEDGLLLEERPGVPDSSLTPRELEVLAWLAKGMTNAEIGLALSISPSTVKKHLEHIYSKMQVHRRTAAAGALPGLTWLR